MLYVKEINNGGPRPPTNTTSTNTTYHIQRFSPAAAIAYKIRWTSTTTIPPAKAATALMIIKPKPTVQSPPLKQLKEQLAEE